MAKLAKALKSHYEVLFIIMILSVSIFGATKSFLSNEKDITAPYLSQIK